MKTIKWIGGIAAVVGTAAIIAATAGAASGDPTYIRIAVQKNPLSAADRACVEGVFEAVFPLAGTLTYGYCLRQAERTGEGDVVDVTRCTCKDDRTVAEDQYTLDDGAAKTDGEPTAVSGGNVTAPYVGAKVALTAKQQTDLEACVGTAWGITGSTMHDLTITPKGADWIGDLDYHTSASHSDYATDKKGKLVRVRTGTVQ